MNNLLQSITARKLDDTIVLAMHDDNLPSVHRNAPEAGDADTSVRGQPEYRTVEKRSKLKLGQNDHAG